jgi:hypothetical protein
MICPKCSSENIGCKDSRPTGHRGYHAIRRRRACQDCSHRWTTYEISEEDIDGLRDSPNLSVLDSLEEFAKKTQDFVSETRSYYETR